MGRFAPWLGHWSPELNGITSQVELVLHGRYEHVPDAPRGSNEWVRNALKELEAIETAVGGGAVRRVRGASTDPPSINHEALNYAHAAAVVRACSFPLSPKMSPQLLQQLLPFCGAYTARIIHQLLVSGTCDPLERFRANQPALNSRGEVRPHTAGGAARELFVRLPGVGQTQALAWFEAGCTTIQDVLQLVLPGHSSTGGAEHTATGPAAAAAAANLAGQQPAASLLLLEGMDGSSTAGFVLGTPAPDAAVDPAAGTLLASGLGGDQGTPTTAAGAAAAPAAGGSAASSSTAAAVHVSKEALYSLQHSQDLLEAVAESDIQEMQQVLLAGLAEVSGAGGGSAAAALAAASAGEDAGAAGGGGRAGGWTVELVGGGRRRKSMHDADFLATHPSVNLEGLMLRLYRWLVSQGRLVPREVGGFLRMQQGRMVGYKARARNDIIAKRWSDKHQMDSYDHCWGIFITGAGRRCRMDVMLVPPDMWPFALLGWSGSKQYLRFLRQHAGNIGLNINSHGLFRMAEVRGKAMLAPATAAAAAAAAVKQSVPSSAAAGQSATAARPASASAAGALTAVGEGAAGAGQQHQGAAAEAGGSSGSSGSSAALAETLEYVRASAAAGMRKVVLAVPDEAPPLDRNGRERWPSGWQPSSASAAGAGAGSGGGSAREEGDSAGAVQLAGPATATAVAQQRAALTALVHAGCGSARAVESEADICELLGIPYREPRERCA